MLAEKDRHLAEIALDITKNDAFLNKIKKLMVGPDIFTYYDKYPGIPVNSCTFTVNILQNAVASQTYVKLFNAVFFPKGVSSAPKLLITLLIHLSLPWQIRSIPGLPRPLPPA